MIECLTQRWIKNGLHFSYYNRKQCITSESQFDFLKELVEKIPDLPANEEEADDDEPKPKRFVNKFETSCKQLVTTC